MNTYDFDQTIFYPDSSYCFYMFCLKRHPLAVLKTVPRTLAELYRYNRDKRDAKALKEQLFSFLKALPDVDAEVREFWRQNFRRIEPWYYSQKREDDVIISASPEFLLSPAADMLGVRLIATRMDKHTGRIDGKNCHDVEKPRRFALEYPGEKPECFYSDSLSDSPMAWTAERAFLVKRGVLSPWPGK